MEPNENQRLDELVEDLLSGPVYVADLFPRSVPGDRLSAFMAAEAYFLSGEPLLDLRQKWAHIAIKLNCFLPLVPWPDPFSLAPGDLLSRVLLGEFTALLSPDPPAYLTIGGDDTYISLYTSDPDVLSLFRAMAQSEGLFFWPAS